LRKAGVLLIVFFFVLGLVAGCAPDAGENTTPEEPTTGTEGEDQEPEGPKVGGQATIAIWSEPSNFNPHIWNTSYDGYVNNLVFDPLIRFKPEGGYEGILAESWEIQDDGKTIVFHLRDNVTWHDGEPFTAEDVKFTYDSLAQPEYDGGNYSLVADFAGADKVKAGEATEVEGIKVIDDYTVSFTTPVPKATVWLRFIEGILPQHILSQVPVADWQRDESNLNPIGTGPFKFVKYETSQFVELEANTDYFLGRPNLDQLIFRIGDQNTMLAAFMNGELDITRVPLSEVELVESSDFASLQVYDSLGIQYVGTNTVAPGLDEVAVRQAIAMAIDRQSIVDSLLRGYGSPISQPLPISLWAYAEDVAGFEYDPEGARALLEDNGWVLNPDTGVREKDGVTLEYDLYYPTGNLIRMQAAPVVQQNLGAVGIKVNLQSMDFPALVSHLLPRDESDQIHTPTAEDFQLYLLGLTFDPDPDGIRTYFHSEHQPPNGYNFINYNNPDVDQLWEESVVAVDFDEREAIVHDLMEILAEEVPWIPLYSEQDLWANNNRLKDFKPNALSLTYNVREWWIDE